MTTYTDAERKAAQDAVIDRITLPPSLSKEEQVEELMPHYLLEVWTGLAGKQIVVDLPVLAEAAELDSDDVLRFIDVLEHDGYSIPSPLKEELIAYRERRKKQSDSTPAPAVAVEPPAETPPPPPPIEPEVGEELAIEQLEEVPPDADIGEVVGEELPASIAPEPAQNPTGKFDHEPTEVLREQLAQYLDFHTEVEWESALTMTSIQLNLKLSAERVQGILEDMAADGEITPEQYADIINTLPETAAEQQAEIDEAVAQVVLETLESELDMLGAATAERVPWPDASPADFVRSLGHQVTEARLMMKERYHPSKRDKNNRSVYLGARAAGFFNDAELLAAEVKPIDEGGASKACYVTLHACDPDMLYRTYNEIQNAGEGDLTASSDIIALHAFPIDIDPARVSGISSTEKELADSMKKAIEVQRWFGGRGICSFRGMSGNGYHVLIYLEPLAATEENIARFEKLGERVADFWNTDSTIYPPGQIWKLYGTWARKGADTPERPHRQSRIKLPPLEQIPRYQFDVIERACDALLAIGNENAETPGEAEKTAPRAFKPSDNGVVQSHAKRFHGDTFDELRDYASDALGIENIGRTIEKRAGYQLARVQCPWEPSHGQDAFLTMTNRKPALYCKHNGCDGRNLEFRYNELGIEKSAWKPFEKRDRIWVEGPAFNVYKTDMRALGYAFKKEPAPSELDTKDGQTVYRWNDVRCDVHEDCIGEYHLMNGTAITRIWRCLTDNQWRAFDRRAEGRNDDNENTGS